VKSKGGLTVALVLVLGAMAATPAHAASTRTEYVSQAEAICRAPAGQLAGIISQLNKVKKAAPHLTPLQGAHRLGKILGRFATLEASILNQLATLTPAPGDEQTVAQWLQGERNANSLVFSAARAGKHGHLRGLLRILNQSISAASQANQIVAGWGFQACVF
jgi:hypothetical protein